MSLPPLSLVFSDFGPGLFWALALCAVLYWWPPASGLPMRSRLFCVSRLTVGCSLVVAVPPPLCVSRFSSPPLGARFFFVRLRCPWLLLVSGLRCPGPFRCVLFVFLAPRFSACCALSPLSCLPPACGLLPGVCSPPPPFCVSRFLSLPLGARFFFPLCAPVVSGFIPFPALGALGLGAVCCVFPARLVVVSRVLLRPASCRVVLPSLVCFVLCLVFCGVLVSGWVLAPCRGGFHSAAYVVLCCCALLRSVLVFFCGSLHLCGAPGCFGFCALLVRCGAGVPAALLSVRCSLAPAALAGVLCGCLLCLRVCRWAWLSSVDPCWVLVGPGVVLRWCAVVFPWVLCCAALLRVVPPGVALLCAVLSRFALLDAVARCVVSWCAVRCPVVPCLRRCVVSCLAALCVFCCGVLLPGVVFSAVCVLGCRTVRSLSFSTLCGVAVLPCSPLVPCSPVLCPVVLCCCVVLWCPVLLPCSLGFSYL